MHRLHPAAKALDGAHCRVKGEADAHAATVLRKPLRKSAEGSVNKARAIGLNLPIWPVKGYTASIPIEGHVGAPKVGVIEEDNLVAFANLGDTLRVGGKAEFTGYDTSYSAANFRGIMSVSKELFPQAGDYTRPRYWACLRPVSAGGPPILGETPVANLFLNVGHGAAGWTEGNPSR